MKILMVLTSHNKLGTTGKPTGFWLEEFAAPFYVFKDAGAQVTLASPAGGMPPIDPASDKPDAESPATTRFKSDPAAQQALSATRKLADLNAGEFAAVFYPGGHGPLWDLSENMDSIGLLERFARDNKPIAAVCHAPGVLRHVHAAGGDWLVKDKRVTGFSNSEEAAAGLTKVVPFLVEDMLVAKGGHYSGAPDWEPYVVVDGQLVTGQNPASSARAAEALLQLLKQ